MKKIYQTPAIIVIAMKTASLIATSIEIKDEDATSTGMARESDFFDDED